MGLREVEAVLEDGRRRGLCWISERPRALALELVYYLELFGEDELGEVQSRIEAWQEKKREERVLELRDMRRRGV